jgi:hypothetical protein
MINYPQKILMAFAIDIQPRQILGILFFSTGAAEILIFVVFKLRVDFWLTDFASSLATLMIRF